MALKDASMHSLHVVRQANNKRQGQQGSSLNQSSELVNSNVAACALTEFEFKSSIVD